MSELLSRILALLKKIEHVENSVRFCPCCGYETGHDEDCELKAVIDELEGE